ncbi:MAG: pyruvate kinase [bacterium]|nr:pyruvate kinase [bacterium]
MKPVKTKIIATLGPSCASVTTIKKMIRSGADLFRINFSHSDENFAEMLVSNVRKASSALGEPVGILADLQGPKIRVGVFESGSIVVKKGDTVTITARNTVGGEGLIPTIYPLFAKDIAVNDRILINDGLIELKAIYKKGEEVKCRVLSGGEIKNHKGINLPGVKISSPSLTPKDKKDLLTAARLGIDYVGYSFVRSADDVKKIRKFMASRKIDIPVIAKIEKPEALSDIEKIASFSDGVMVARGDLGVEIPVEDVPIVQKRIISLANKERIPVITATQMMESMIERPVPTRAEVSDIANAVFDGTDAVMLSGETSVGKYPVKAVNLMNRIVRKSENSGYEPGIVSEINRGINDFPFSIAYAACKAADEAEADWIIVYTRTGKTALNISKRKPPTNVIALSSSRETVNRMCLFKGVFPFRIKNCVNYSDAIKEGKKMLIAKKVIKKGQVVVVIMGDTTDDFSANTLKIARI